MFSKHDGLLPKPFSILIRHRHNTLVLLSPLVAGNVSTTDIMQTLPNMLAITFCLTIGK
jgi:hypothetical protein